MKRIAADQIRLEHLRDTPEARALPGHSLIGIRLPNGGPVLVVTSIMAVDASVTYPNGEKKTIPMLLLSPGGQTVPVTPADLLGSLPSPSEH